MSRRHPAATPPPSRHENPRSAVNRGSGGRDAACVPSGVPRHVRHYPEGSYWFVTDRCAAEAYLLLPDRPEVAEIIESAWREGLRRFPVELCALLVMSNHWHAVLSATTAEQNSIPSLMQYVKSTVAFEINRLRGRQGTFWSKRYTAIPVVDDESVIDRIGYTLHNPANAGLCGTASEWPGLSTLEASTDERAACGPIDLPVALPPAWRGMDPGQLAKQRRSLRHELRDRERAVAATRRAAGLKRPRVDRVISAVTWSDRPALPKRSRAPACFAATEAARKMYRKMRREIVRAYLMASDAFRSGVLDVMFPASMFAPRLERPPNEAT